MRVKSLEELNQRYAQFAIPILQKHGGQMIAGTPTPNVKEGDWDGNWAAVLSSRVWKQPKAGITLRSINPIKTFASMNCNLRQVELL